MTIRKIRTAVGDRRGALAAARYVLEAVDLAEAFSEPGDGPQQASTVWVGSQEALDKLGLERGKEVDVEELVAALQGQHVETGEQVRRPGSVVAKDAKGRERLDENGEAFREQVVNTFDLTVGMPKSWAVLYSQADGELKAELAQAALDSAYEAVDYLVKTRPVIGGEEPAKGFVASAAVHVTARTAHGEMVPSPHVHVHMHMLGVLDGEGNLRTPHSPALYKHSAMRVGGAVARLAGARKAEQLGFQVEPGTGRGGRYFEIRGVSKELCDRMSGRTRDVLAWVKLVGARTTGAASRGAVATRVEKSDVPPERIKEVWRAQGSECNFGRAEIADIRDLPPVERDVPALQQLVRKRVLEQLWLEGPTISRGAIEGMAIEYAVHGLSREQALGVLEQMQASGELIVLDEWLVTSREIREKELEVAAIAEEAAKRPRTPASKAAFKKGIATAERNLGFKLTKDQHKAVRTLTRGAGWSVLTGLAGTGKGPVLEAVAEAHRLDGGEIVACAVANSTARRLAVQVGGDAMSVERLMYRLDEGYIQPSERTLIVVEEASLVGLEDWERLAHVVKYNSARILLVGDVFQVGAIECPGMLDWMIENDIIPRAVLDQVQRHRHPDNPEELHPWLATYQKALRAGKTEDAIGELRKHDAITMHETRADAIVGLVDRWESRRRERNIAAKDAILIVYGSNDEINIVNAYAQERRLRAKEIGGDSVLAPNRDYELYAGDVVMLRDAAYWFERDPVSRQRPAPVENGTVGIVKSVDTANERVVVAFDEPGGTRRATIDVGVLRRKWETHVEASGAPRIPSLELFYSGHPLPTQGGTWKYVGSLWGHWSQLLNSTYGGDTRVKFWLDVHTDIESIGYDPDEPDPYQRQANHLKRNWHRKASINYEATPEIAIAAASPELDAAPRLPLRGGDTEREVASATTRPELLRELEELLGAEHVELVADRAAALREVAWRLDVDHLEAASREGRKLVERFDRGATWELGRMEQGQLKAAERIDNARERAAELKAEAGELHGLRNRRKRSDLLEEVASLERAIEHDRETRAKLERRAEELDEDRKAWLGENGEKLARAVAAERAMAARGVPGWREQRTARVDVEHVPQDVGQGPDLVP